MPRCLRAGARWCRCSVPTKPGSNNGPHRPPARIPRRLPARGGLGNADRLQRAADPGVGTGDGSGRAAAAGGQSVSGSDTRRTEYRGRGGRLFRRPPVHRAGHRCVWGDAGCAGDSRKSDGGATAASGNALFSAPSRAGSGAPGAGRRGPAGACARRRRAAAGRPGPAVAGTAGAAVQPLGLFAGSGVGKSILLGMMARFTEADVVVVGLIGERGREVKEFIDNILGAEGMARAVVVASPADHPPLMRANGAAYAMAIAEYFRDQDKHVLLIMDSLTRYAMAQREVALAIGEPPATKGYPPSVFAKLPQLAERAGNGRSGSGSITAFFTVLMEGDDQQDPIADAARAILDGHIVLSRDLADSGHYPAIDIEASISRAQPDLLNEDGLERVRRFKYLYSRYMRSRDLLAVGAYVPGADVVLDQGVRLYPKMQAYLMQGMRDRAPMEAARSELDEVLD